MSILLDRDKQLEIAITQNVNEKAKKATEALKEKLRRDNFVREMEKQVKEKGRWDLDPDKDY